MLRSLGTPLYLGVASVGILAASFAATTLDTATRLRRRVVGELAREARTAFIGSGWFATTLAVISAALLACAISADGAGALRL